MRHQDSGCWLQWVGEVMAELGTRWLDGTVKDLTSVWSNGMMGADHIIKNKLAHQSRLCMDQQRICLMYQPGWWPF